MFVIDRQPVHYGTVYYTASSAKVVSGPCKSGHGVKYHNVRNNGLENIAHQSIKQGAVKVKKLFEVILEKCQHRMKNDWIVIYIP